MDHPSVSVVECPTERSDAWAEVVRPLRATRDYARFLDPLFGHAEALRGRANGVVASAFLRFCERHAWLKRRWRLIGQALGIVEEVIPSDPAFDRFVESERPDIILITPLIQFSSYQTDYVKSAHQLGIPIALLVFSWDNLTSKGLMRVIPDRVFVWNRTQRWEAVRLHGAPARDVVVTGAPRFDRFFALRPSIDRVRFCREHGLDPRRPFIAYLCSSDFVAPREVEFVRRWVGEIRRSTDSALRSCGVLVRLHPASTPQWEGADLSDLPGVAVQQPEASGDAEQSLYDSLHHAAAAVGLNTSALLEAGIVGKAVHTILASDSAPGQQGSVHFDYLLRSDGGLLTVARNFDEHRAQLAAALASDSPRCERSLRFIEGFVRPHGLDQPATPIMVREIERLAAIRKRPRRRTPLWHYPARWALMAWIPGWIARARGGAPPRRPGGAKGLAESAAPSLATPRATELAEPGRREPLG